MNTVNFFFRLKRCNIKIIDKYILRELLLPFFLGFLVFTFILVMNRIFELVDLLVGKGLSIGMVFHVFYLSMPFIIALTVPMGVLVGILSVYGRLSSDSEIIALQSAGISPIRLIYPALYFAIAMTIGMTLFNNHILPKANYNLKLLLVKISRKRPTINIKEKRFNRIYRGYTIWVDRIDYAKSEVYGVKIFQKNGTNIPKIVVAKDGKIFVSNDGENFVIYLHSGEVHELTSADPSHYRITRFNKHILKIPLGKRHMPSTVIKGSREMNTRELLEKAESVKNRRVKWTYLVEANKKFSIPFAAVVFVFIGFPFGLMVRKGGLGIGLALSLAVFLIYYVFLIGGEQISDRGYLHPAIAMWLANIVIGGIGIFLTRRVVHG